MSRAGMLILLGVLALLTPLSGLPIAVRSLLGAIVGVCVLSIGLRMRGEQAPKVAAAQTIEPEPVASPAPPTAMSAV